VYCEPIIMQTQKTRDMLQRTFINTIGFLIW
jgi:hypothetical protein